MPYDPDLTSQTGGQSHEQGGHMFKKEEPVPYTPRHHICDRCQQDLATRNQNLGERVDIWTTASNLLKGREFPDNDQPTAEDVLYLAIFLAEENSS
jgi:hypothetical protein